MGPELRIQVISDLHGEMSRANPTKIPVKAPVLALLGDIGIPGTKIYARLLKTVSDDFETVLVLAGNHEFYQDKFHGVESDYEQRKLEIKDLWARFSNVHMLDCASVRLGGVTVLGCTLWSHVPPSAESDVISGNGVDDYKCIRIRDPDTGFVRSLQITDTNAFHAKEVAFLQGEIAAAAADGRTVLVLAHFAPLMTGTSAPWHPPNRGLNHAFRSDLSDLMGSPVAAWVYGHTHYNPRGLEANGTRVLANQKGYSNEDTGRPFDPGLVLHVKGPMETTIETRWATKGDSCTPMTGLQRMGSITVSN